MNTNTKAEIIDPSAQVLEPARKGGVAFHKGHPKYGGRKKGSPIKRTAEAREIAESLGFHPVHFLATIAYFGVMPNADGTETAVDTATRMDAAKSVIKYLVPALLATQITGKNEGPLEVAAFDMTQLMMNPAAVEAAQQLALAMVEMKTLPAPEQNTE
jgi:hypothetical protein